MSMYKTWTESTIMSYKKDVENFEEYLIKLDIEPIISNGKLHVIQKWVKDLKEAGVAFTTIKRRLASLSSIVEFYRNLGLLDQNCFKIVEAPIGDQSQPSTILDLVQMQQVYQYSESLLNEQEKYIVPPFECLFFLV
ncbi:site-specific integrase [Brevibacillus brevis]|nr:site-specific integrase [Brevibacillus brevis]